MEKSSMDAGAWVRVSSGGQDEANQIPDIERHCAEQGHRITKWYTLNDKSASKGEQQAMLDQVVADMKLGIITTVVCWHSDRMERRGPEALFRLLRQVRDAGGRIESTKEPLFGTTDLGGEAMTAFGAVIAHQYSVHLAQQVKAGHDRGRANHALTPGGIPWGYVVTGAKYNKTIVPTDECRTYVPQIFQRCIDGDSCRTIALWLDAEGVKPTRGSQWSETSVWQLLKNMTYTGRRQDEGTLRPDGTPTRKNRHTLTRCEAVISLDTWKRANEALAKRPGRGPGVNGVLRPKPLLVSLKCARCEDSPMYRIRSGGGMYYRCTGRRPTRQGCGNMIPLEQLDTIVTTHFLTWHERPHKIRTWVEGENWDADIDQIGQDIHELDPVTDPEYALKHAELIAQLADYQERNRKAKPGYWDEIDTHMTEGEYFYQLSEDGRRGYLKASDIRAAKVTDDQGVEGVRLVIDGEERGVFPYPPTRLLHRAG
jgi:DNA invertase Pin-like site-specific DNA recombinase